MTNEQIDSLQKETEQLRQEVTRLRHIEAGLRREIRERERLETAVADSNVGFQRVFDYAPIGMALVGLDEQILKVNQALCDILGYDCETLLTKSVPENTHPDDIAIEAQYKEKTKEAQFDNFWMEKRYIHADGHIVWGRLSVSAVLDQEGQPLYFIGQLEDITERKRAEEALRKSEARFRALVEQSPFSIIIYDKNGQGVNVLLIVMVVVVVLEQIGIDASIMTNIFTNVITIIVAGLALVFALGGRNTAQNILAGHYAREQYSADDILIIDKEEGILEGIGTMNSEILIGDERLIVPNTRLIENTVKIKQLDRPTPPNKSKWKYTKLNLICYHI